MTRWFGQSWGAIICKPPAQVPTPVGIACSQCREPIRRDDRGFVFTLVEADAVGNAVISDIAQHLRCFVLSLACPGCPRCKPKPAERQLDERLN